MEQNKCKKKKRRKNNGQEEIFKNSPEQNKQINKQTECVCMTLPHWSSTSNIGVRLYFLTHQYLRAAKVGKA